MTDEPTDFRRSPVQCLACGADCFEILAEHPGGEPANLLKAVGPLLPTATLVRFHLADGTRTDLPACHACAATLPTADLATVWRTLLDASERHYTALAEGADRWDWVAGVWAQTASLRARPPVRLQVLG